MNRRQVLEGFGALAATAACSSGESPPGDGAAGSPAAQGGSPSDVGGQASTIAGQANAAAGRAQTGTGGSGGQATNPAGTGGTGSGQSGATAETGGGGQGAGTSSGGAPATGGQSTTGGAGTGGAATNDAGSANAGAAGSGGGGDTLVPPPWDDVPMCTASKTDAAGQGPFFIHELEKGDDSPLARQDIRGRYNEDAEPGVEMHLHLRILDATNTECNAKPVEGVEVYIWHTDAQGYYSGFGARGTDTEQKPDMPYAGKPGQNDLQNSDRFLRGIQTTNADGVVSFRSIYPGWYNGRDLHIHFVAFKPGSTSQGRVTYSASNSDDKWLFTTQFYFDPAFSKSIHEKNQPYLRRTTIDAYAGAIAADESGNSGLRTKSSLAGDTDGVGGIVTSQIQILLDPKA